jgi:hypothetical protein
MSTPDMMMALLSTPWRDADGDTLPVRPLPGLRPEVINTLESGYSGNVHPGFRALLRVCCGIVGTEIGSIDFTGYWYPEESCPVFRPCLTLASDAEGRRWIAELGERDLPGPVWCVFRDPEVAVYVSDDIAGFVAGLHECVRYHQMTAWLRALGVQARTIWSSRRALARYPYQAVRSDAGLRGWLVGLPPDADVFDLRTNAQIRGWPYGCRGPSGRLYRCGRLPVFAVAVPSEGARVPNPLSIDNECIYM